MSNPSVVAVDLGVAIQETKRIIDELEAHLKGTTISPHYDDILKKHRVSGEVVLAGLRNTLNNMQAAAEVAAATMEAGNATDDAAEAGS